LLWRLNAATFLVMCAYAAICTTVASHVQLLGGGAATTGLVVAASAGLRAGTGYAFGLLAHRLGYRATMIARLGLLAGGSLCTVLHQGLAGLVAWQSSASCFRATLELALCASVAVAILCVACALAVASTKATAS
jgi:MFS family permease